LIALLQIVVKFEKFELERHKTCQYDSLTLYDGLNRSAPRLGVFCDASDNFIAPQVSSGNAMMLYFYSDHIMNAKGSYF